MYNLIGTWVRVKGTDGPPMKVITVQENMCSCRWKNERGMLCAEDFHRTSLRPAKPPKEK